MAIQHPADLLKRLLNLFPIKILRDNYQVQGNSQEVIINDLVRLQPQAGLIKFSFDNFDTCKQHIYCYNLDRNFSGNGFTNQGFPFHVEHSAIRAHGLTLYCLVKVTYDVILINPYQTDNIEFYQPVKIIIENDSLVMHFIILEKNLNSYFDATRLVNTKRDIDEEIIKRDIIAFFNTYTFDICDLNRGVKFLWANDLIDGKYVKYKKTKSTTTEAMDEGETYKHNYPVEYLQMMQTPLSKTVVKYLPVDDLLCDVFTVDPSKGEISFNKYPKTINQIENVITKIISNN